MQEVRLSPDGRWLAYAVRWPDVASDSLRTSVYVIATQGTATPRLVYQGSSISGLAWRPGTDTFTYGTNADGALILWSVDPVLGTPTQITKLSHGSQAIWHPDGQRLAYLVHVDLEKDVLDQRVRSGVVMGTRVGGLDLIEKVWQQGHAELRTIDVKTGQDTTLRRFEPGVSVQLTSWSPNGKLLAAVMTHHGAPDQEGWPPRADFELLASDSGRGVTTVPGVGYVTASSWSSDSGRLAFLRSGDEAAGTVSAPVGLQVLTLNGARLERLAMPAQVNSLRNVTWSPSGDALYVEAVGDQRIVRGVYRVGLADHRWTWIHERQGHYSKCSFAADAKDAICIAESATSPPDPVAVNVTTGKTRALASLNPEYHGILLSDATELRVTNDYGVASSTFLLKPIDYVEGRHYPLVVILYRFTGEFHVDVFGNYPIQAFAANGYAVALVSVVSTPFRSGDAMAGLISEAYGPLSSIEASVSTIVKMGIADPARVGLMGWSYGSFLTDFAVTRSKTFAVASSGDGALYSPESYWFGGGLAQSFMGAVLAGPPEGGSRKNWSMISPELSVDQVDTPMLFEYASSNILGAAFYSALQRRGVPSEFVVYPDAPHVFNEGRPSQRRASLARNFDWFNFWLLHKEDPNPAKADQYARWRQLKRIAGDRPRDKRETLP